MIKCNGYLCRRHNGPWDNVCLAVVASPPRAIGGPRVRYVVPVIRVDASVMSHNADEPTVDLDASGILRELNEFIGGDNINEFGRNTRHWVELGTD